MASTFSFGFSGDDIDMDVDNDIEVEIENNVSEKPNSEDTTATTTLFPAIKHALKDWVRTFHLSSSRYTSLTRIPRRQISPLRYHTIH